MAMSKLWPAYSFGWKVLVEKRFLQLLNNVARVVSFDPYFLNMLEKTYRKKTIIMDPAEKMTKAKHDQAQFSQSAVKIKLNKQAGNGISRCHV